MIRPLTLITMLLAAGSGAYLFAVKHRAQVLDDQLAQVADQSRQDAERIRVLNAQWALETAPGRLSQLATQFTSLKQMQPAQLVTFAALQAALPRAGSPPPGAAAPLPALPMIAAAGTGALPLPPEAAPAPPSGASISVASVSTPVHAVPSHAAKSTPADAPESFASVESLVHGLHTDSASALHLAAAHSVATLPPPRPLYAAPPRPLYANPPRALYAAPPRALYLARASPPALPMGAEVMKVNAASPAQNGGSMLGMASALAPPQPLNQSGAVN